MTSVHLISGKDPLLRQRALEGLLARLTRDDPELEVETHEAVELEGLPELRTTSLFGGRVCAVVRDIEGARKDLKDELEAYLAAPDDEAVLVLTATSLRLQKIVKLVKEHGEVTKVDTPPDWKDGEWKRIVSDEFTRAGRRATASAVETLLEHAGNDPSVIATKVAQVVAATDGKEIDGGAVEASIEGHGRQSAFQLADAIADRDAETAIVLLRGLLEAGEAPLAILGAVTYRFRALQQVRGGVRPPRMSQGQYGHTRRAAGNFTPGELAWCLDRIAQLDVDLKGNTDLPDELVLEFGVIDLATSREVGLPFNPLAATGAG